MNQANFIENEDDQTAPPPVLRRGLSARAFFKRHAVHIPSRRQCFFAAFIAVFVAVVAVRVCHQIGWVSPWVCQLVELGGIAAFWGFTWQLTTVLNKVTQLRWTIVVGASLLVLSQLFRILATLQEQGTTSLPGPMLALLPLLQPIVLALAMFLLIGGFVFALSQAEKALRWVQSDRNRIATYGARQDEANSALKSILEEKANASVTALSEHRRAEFDKVRLEHQLSASQKMRAVGTLAGGVAHDFNNILTAILGYADLGARKAVPHSKEKFYFDEVERAAMRAKELVRQLLLFSHQGEEESVVVDFRLIIEEVLAALQTTHSDNIKIETNFSDEPCLLMCNPAQMHHVLQNLVLNARYAMRKNGGILKVRLEPVDVKQTLDAEGASVEPGEYLFLSVSDTGEGMSASVQQRVFEPFFTTKPVDQGAGMGLSIAHGIVSNLNGLIRIVQQEGPGTTFALYLPRHDPVTPTAKRQRATRRRNALSGSERILVVDDEPELLALWTQLLLSAGYQVTACSQSSEALDKVQGNCAQFDLVLLDQNMPGMKGIELAAEILAIRAELPILMATGFYEDGLIEEGRALGIRDFIMKPILAQDLCCAIRKALDGATARLT